MDYGKPVGVQRSLNITLPVYLIYLVHDFLIYYQGDLNFSLLKLDFMSQVIILPNLHSHLFMLFFL